MSHNFKRLSEGIIAASEAKEWEPARMEWGLHSIFFENDQQCLCGHNPITENCILVNELNGNRTVVGNVCVKKFMGIDASRIFMCIKKIARRPWLGLNEETVRYCFKRGIIDHWQYGFSLNTIGKQYEHMSHRQRVQRQRINKRICKKVKVYE